jgi:hypothetical protein
MVGNREQCYGQAREQTQHDLVPSKGDMKPEFTKPLFAI